MGLKTGGYNSFWKMLQENPDIPIILWGAGRHYGHYKKFIRFRFHVDYIHDKKWEGDDINSFDEYRVLKFKDMKDIGKCLVIFCLTKFEEIEEASREARDHLPNALFFRLRDLFYLDKAEVTSNSARINSSEYVYEDVWGNSIRYETPNSLIGVVVRFLGADSHVRLGKEIHTVNRCNIECGNNALVAIGEKTTIGSADLLASWGAISIGKDCMLSWGILIRNHDSHHIFDMKLGTRLNYSKAINIGDRVWIWQDAKLMKGFAIGSDSVVGAGSVSSAVFPSNVIIGGNPARIIRQDIVWRRDNTWINNYDNIRAIQKL